MCKIIYVKLQPNIFTWWWKLRRNRFIPLEISWLSSQITVQFAQGTGEPNKQFLWCRLKVKEISWLADQKSNKRRSDASLETFPILSWRYSLNRPLLFLVLWGLTSWQYAGIFKTWGTFITSHYLYSVLGELGKVCLVRNLSDNPRNSTRY